MEVASLTLAPGAAREEILGGLAGNPDLRNSFLVRSDSAAGDVVAKLVSASESRLHEVELLGKDEKDQENGGGHPWSLEGGTDSVLLLLLFNHTNRPQSYNLAIASGAILWQKLLTIPPFQTEAFSFRQLVAGQVPDDKGRKLSVDVTQGSVSWWTPNPEQGRGRLLQVNRDTAMARNFSCGYNIVLCGAQFLPDVVLWGLGYVSSFGQVEGNTCTAWGPNMCSGDQYGTGGGYNYGWSSYNTGVITISGSSNNSSVNTYGAGVGSAYQNGQVTSTYCQENSGGTGTVLQLSQSPPTVAMSSGDTAQAISVTVSGGSGNLSFTTKLSSNPNSSTTASAAVAGGTNVTGTANYLISVSGLTSCPTNCPSGISTATACVGAACAPTSTTITIPPQNLVQMLYGEADGQQGTGDTSQISVGSAARNRINNSDSPGNTNWQNTVASTGFSLWSTSPPNQAGHYNETANAAGLFSGTISDQVGGAGCFWSPTNYPHNPPSQWDNIVTALNSKTTTFPAKTGNPACYGSVPRQIVIKTSVGTNNRGGNFAGAPAFVFLRKRNATDPAVVQIP